MSVIGVHAFPVSFTRFEHHQHNMGVVKALSPGAKFLVQLRKRVLALVVSSVDILGFQ